MRWKTIDQRLAGAVIRGLRYAPEHGVVAIQLEDGRELLVSACCDGCHIILTLPNPTTQRRSLRFAIGLRPGRRHIRAVATAGFRVHGLNPS